MIDGKNRVCQTHTFVLSWLFERFHYHHEEDNKDLSVVNFFQDCSFRIFKNQYYPTQKSTAYVIVSCFKEAKTCL